MSEVDALQAPSRATPQTHRRGQDKVSKITVRINPAYQAPTLKKPEWIRARLPVGEGVVRVKKLLREHHLASVCEEAMCPNMGECFSHGTASFMILGDICTRRCAFCDVAFGKPRAVDPEEPLQLAKSVAALQLRHVVITSVNRDDLPDGGAGHFAACVRAIHEQSPTTRVEILVPDFRQHEALALSAFVETGLPEVFNHNLESVPRLYSLVRPSAIYTGSLKLLQTFKQQHPEVLTKSGLMVGLGEEKDEILQVMQDLRDHDCDMLTIGQYLQPTKHHHPVVRYWTPQEFIELRQAGEAMGFSNVASGAMVRSSYQADRQAQHVLDETIS